MLCSAHSFFRSLALGNALGHQMRSKILLEFPFFFRVDDLFEQFQILCKLCLMHFETVSDADWPRLEIAFLMHSCLRVSWFIKPNRFAGHLRGRAMWDAEPQKGSRKPRGSCKQTHTHMHLRAAVATPYRQQFDLLFTLNIFYFSFL